MPPYTSLFGPRQMKPNPSAAEAIRDPLGRDGHLWDQEQENPDLDGKLEAARADWRGDASLNSLFGTNGAFTLEDTVGKQGKNRPGDVFKVQSLLHREGLLDADKTDGPTGFLGIYDHEAIEKFQKENGLKQDGWMGPNGETIKAFETLYQPAGNQPQPQQPAQIQPSRAISLLDPKAWEDLQSRLPAWYRPAGAASNEAGTMANLETIAGGSGQDAVTLPQQGDNLKRAQQLPAKRPPIPQIKPDIEVITRGRQEVEAIKNAERQAIIAKRNAEIDDYLDDPRVQAFLDTLGHFESRGSYSVITGGGRFTDMSRHPNSKNEDGNTAAGKYQFTKGTWDEFSEPVGAKDFSPKTQDRVAVHLLQRIGVIDRLLKGDVAGAVMRAGRRWDAFPKNEAGDNILNNGKRKIGPILDEYQKRLDAFRK